MREVIKRVLCKIGFHEWKYQKLKYDSEYRFCKRCPKKQHWLAGHGGSEIGCWQ